MKKPLSQLFACVTVAVAFVGCSTMLPGPPIHFDGYGTLSAQDQREIGRLLPRLGIHAPITSITVKDSDHATVYCKEKLLSEVEGERVEITVVRRAGHWIVVDRPHKVKFTMTS
jgi:hypothetical protein